MTSHHPTTAELAAFRLELRDRYGRTADRSFFVHPCDRCGPALDVAAWPEERTHGIGTPWRDGLAEDPPTLYPDDVASMSSDARRGAAALRSAAYGRRFPGHPKYLAAWPAELEEGCPDATGWRQFSR